ncbi:MAG: MarR family transcriptional regulator [Gammaproteobacteria bacterium]|nr:MarR family transcriptional regulator [Gammaproteobacteria bacterium]
MQWESIGFKANPFDTDPITQATLALYTGNEKKVAACKNVLNEKNVLIIIEGSRGVGTTSFANNLRFSAQDEKSYFTPFKEIRVEEGCTLEALLAMVIANVIREIEIFHAGKILKDKRFQDAKAISSRIAETYRNFGIDALGFGASYGQSPGINSQPVIVPAGVLGHHLEDLCALVQSTLGYKYGILLQFNNLDIGVIHNERHLKYLFNGLRDYIQTDYLSCMLVGDFGLRRFIAQKVDRLDDIVSYEIEINSLSQKEYLELIGRRINFYKSQKNAELPIEKEVFLYLFNLTKGRLRYIFGLLSRLLNDLYIGDLADKLTLSIAKPMIARLAKTRLSKDGLTAGEEVILAVLAKKEKLSVIDITKLTGKSKQYISRTVIKLLQHGFVTVQRQGRYKYYSPILDVIIAYSD